MVDLVEYYIHKIRHFPPAAMQILLTFIIDFDQPDLKPILLCWPSQKGLFLDAPQRHRATF